jgi:hypothetical protein
MWAVQRQVCCSVSLFGEGLARCLKVRRRRKCPLKAAVFGCEVQEVRERGGRCFVRALFMRRLRRSLGAVGAWLVVPARNATAPE